MAMSPRRSTARLAIQRLLESGLNVDAWRASPMVPPVTGTWYHRTAAWLDELPATVWVAHSDSTPPMFEYWSCIISRIARESRSFPPSSATVDGGEDHDVVVAESVGPVNVELAGVVKS